MAFKTVATLPTDLNVTRSTSGPRSPNDDPASEAWFKRLKYAPIFTERFGSVPDAKSV